MKRTIDVVLGEGQRVGTLRYDLQGRRENAVFEYGAGWLGDPAHFSLGPTLPLQAGPQFHLKSKDGSPSMLPLPTQSLMDGQGVSFCAITLNENRNCAVKEK